MIAISNDRNGCSISVLIIQAKMHFWNNEQEHSCIRVKYISNRKVVKIYNIISIILHNEINYLNVKITASPGTVWGFSENEQESNCKAEFDQSLTDRFY